MERNRDPRSQKHLGRAVRVLRDRAGLTQNALGKRADLDPTWISHIESGHVNITWGNLRRVASGLGVGLDGLLSLTRDYEMADAVGTAVRVLRQEQGSTQASVATRAGLKTGQLSSIENGSAAIPTARLEGKLRRGLRVRMKRWTCALEEAMHDLGIA